jgi:hypothetical protein
MSRALQSLQQLKQKRDFMKRPGDSFTPPERGVVKSSVGGHSGSFFPFNANFYFDSTFVWLKAMIC